VTVTLVAAGVKMLGEYRLSCLLHLQELQQQQILTRFCNPLSSAESANAGNTPLDGTLT
jgi:hypothetical protein